MTQDEAERINRQLDSDAAREWAEQQMLLAFQSAFAGQRERLVDALRANEGVLSAAQQERLWAGENETFWNSIRETILDVASERAVVAAVSGGNLDTWNLIDERVIAWAEDYYIDADGDTYGSVPNLNLTTRTEFQKRFVEWQRGELGVSGRTETGELREGLDALIASLEPVFGVERAERIAITEISRVFAMAELESARSNEFVEYLMYEASVDERVCPICGPRHGTVVQKNADGFGAPGDSMVSFPPVHVRCRCQIVSLTGPAYEALREQGRTHA
jgi:SPP1 gp7 family putative phage head morphogenesis protein